MTDAQIERIKARMGSRPSATTVEDFARLIEERHRLLEALNQLRFTVVLRESDATITGPGLKQAAAAIAFAEEEAK